VLDQRFYKLFPAHIINVTSSSPLHLFSFVEPVTVSGKKEFAATASRGCVVANVKSLLFAADHRVERTLDLPHFRFVYFQQEWKKSVIATWFHVCLGGFEPITLFRPIACFETAP
jgi:hypothetical protein